MKKELREIPIFVTSIPEYTAFLFENKVDNTPKVYQVYTLARLQLRKDVYFLEEKLKEVEVELELRSSWVKHHQACVEANSIREHKLEERLSHLEKVCENSIDSEHGYEQYRKTFKLGKG